MASWIESWPVLRQLRGTDRLGRGSAVTSSSTAALRPRTATADRVVKSVCPYCAVGCGAARLRARTGRSPRSRATPTRRSAAGGSARRAPRPCSSPPAPSREHQVLYRRPHGTDWEDLRLDTAMDMIADRVIDTPARHLAGLDDDGNALRRTLGIADLGGATLDNEENYLIKKLFTALGVDPDREPGAHMTQLHRPRSGDILRAGRRDDVPAGPAERDCIVIEGSNMAECHPVGFQWVMEAKARGATVIHVDPRFTRTSALADLHVPIRAGSDIAFLGGIVNYVLENERVLPRVRASPTPTRPTILGEDFADTEDLDGLFSGLRPETRAPTTTTTWQYEGAEVAAVGRPARPGVRRAGRRRPRVAEPPGRVARLRRRGDRRRRARARDPTLQHPRCVFQMLKRHYARYTPEMVERGLRRPAGAVPRGRRAAHRQLRPRPHDAFVYAVGWTQHTVGVQYIRTAAILQLLLGNIGRPGGGILALRGHASIQGSTDIPTLFNLLPGYIPMPHAHAGREPRRPSSRPRRREKGFWGNMRAYIVSLLKAYWGDAATADNDFCFDYLPRLTGDHSTYETVVSAARRRRARATSCWARTRRSARPTPGCSGSAWRSSTGSSSATSR